MFFCSKYKIIQLHNKYYYEGTMNNNFFQMKMMKTLNVAGNDQYDILQPIQGTLVSKINSNKLTLVALYLGMFLLVGCAETKQPNSWGPMVKEVKGSGFLGDLYPKQHKGGEDESLLVYRNPKIENKTSFAQYTKILLDPVQLYSGAGSNLPSVTKEQQAIIAQALYAQLYNQLSKDYEMVTQAGPNTLHVQSAIVDGDASGGWVEAISYIPIPAGFPGVKIALFQIKDKTTGKPPFVGEVTVEGKYTDAQTEEVLAAVIDRRVGVRHPIYGIFEKNTYDKWHDVDEAFRYWAEKLRFRLCQRRGGTNCIAPKE